MLFLVGHLQIHVFTLYLRRRRANCLFEGNLYKLLVSENQDFIKILNRFSLQFLKCFFVDGVVLVSLMKKVEMLYCK